MTNMEPVPAPAPAISCRPGTYAKRLDVSRAYVYRLIQEGIIKARKINEVTLIFDAENQDIHERLAVLTLKTPGKS